MEICGITGVMFPYFLINVMVCVVMQTPQNSLFGEFLKWETGDFAANETGSSCARDCHPM
jgi:hypothetical protein